MSYSTISKSLNVSNAFELKKIAFTEVNRTKIHFDKI